MLSKYCPVCELTKPHSEFSKCSNRVDGVQGICKECRKAKRLPDAQKYRDQAKAWKIANPDRYREHSRKAELKRRAIKAGSTIGQVPDISTFVAYYGDSCMYPNCSMVNLTIDHIVPLSKGGGHEADNIQLLCAYHNSVKGNTEQIDYRPYGWRL